jgi:type IV secretory pathway VirJ component
MRRSLAVFLCAAAVGVLATSTLTGCAARLHSMPGAYESRTAPLRVDGRDLTVTYVTPATPRTDEMLILFASGDGGWWGVSGEVLEHLAERGYYVVAYDARQIIAREKKLKIRGSITDAAAVFDTILVDTRRSLGLPESMPVVITGYSRGANFCVLTAGVTSLQRHLGGAIAIALTRELDYVKAPVPADGGPAVQVDDKGRIQTYPMIERAGSLPFAVIQAKGDSYVRAEEARRLFGPDTDRRRLYEVDARNHTFAGGSDQLMRDLDDALAWIEGILSAR